MCFDDNIFFFHCEEEISLLWMVDKMVCNHIFDMILDIATYAASSEFWIECCLGDVLYAFCIEFKIHSYSCQSLLEFVELECDDFLERFLIERIEYGDLINTIDEFWCKILIERADDFVSDFVKISLDIILFFT